MKIGILTQPLGENYGGILQNWALQQILKKLGYESETIFYRFKNKKQIIGENIECLIRYVVKYLIFHPTRKINKYPGYYTRPYTRLRRFIRRNINHTPFLNKIDYDYLKNKRGISAFIVGSDQVWRPKYNFEFYYDMFCDFLPANSNCKRIAYAGSFGVAEWELNDEQTEVAKRNLAQFNAISVREKSGVDLCRSKLGLNAEFVLDPTLLLTKDDYLKIAEQAKSHESKNKIGVFILDYTKDKRDAVDTICRILNSEPFYIGVNNGKSRLVPSVEDWLAAFNNCKFIITDSFHGTVFSVIFQKSFYNILNSSRGSERIYSLLQLLNLEDRIITNSDIDINRAYITKERWEAVEKTLNSKRIESTEFLKNSLS